MEKKEVQFRYDSENKNVIMNFKHNIVKTNDGNSKTIGANLDVLGYDTGIILTAAQECLTEMLDLVNARIAELTPKEEQTAE